VSEAERHNQEDITNLKKGVMHRRGAELIYRNQGELGRAVISSSESASDIRSDLVQFLNRLSISASAIGARTGANGRAVVITTIELLDQKAQNSGDFVNEDGSLDALSQSIHSYGSGSVVVIASALGNSFEGDQVIIMLRPYADTLAIRSGTIIASTVVDGSSSTVDSIAGMLQRFLVTQVRPAAKRAGVIPVKNPQTGAVELGEVTLQQLYEAVSQIRQITGPAVVTASVAADVYSADQLKLVLTVKPGTASGN
jgi:hypothetical protein